ncbi:MAG: hypothetical protein U9N38_03600, partial [Thermodesulfobacteriota bacterium]|nr:hypothetical protein [Thermodesulfobacteriota bacterium]
MKKSRKILYALCAALMFLTAGCAGVSVHKRATLRTGMPEETIQAFESAREAFEKGQFDKAMILYEGILQHFPSGRVASLSHLRIGEVFIARGEYSWAIEELKLIPDKFAEDPIYAEAGYRLALSYSQLGIIDTSEDICKKLLSGKVSPYLRPEIESLMGDNLLKSDRDMPAFDWYMKALKSSPNIKLEESVKKKIEGIIADSLSPNKLQKIQMDYPKGYPSGYLLYALAKASFNIRDFEKTNEYLKMFLSHCKGHPLFEDAKAFLRRIAVIKLTNKYALGCVLPLTGKYATYGNRVL